MSTLSRKKFFKGLAIGTLALPFALRAGLGKPKASGSGKGVGNIDGTTYKWKMVTTWPPNFPIVDEACKKMAELMYTMSNGRLDVKVYAGGELVPSLEAFDTVKSGAAEMGSGSAYYWAGKIPAAQFFSTVPFGMNAQQMNAWLYAGGGMELWQQVYGKENLVPIAGGNTGVQMGGWFNREINSIADLKGLKMRIPGIGGNVLQKAGGTPITLAGGELYTGLERGVIDATEWIGPFHDYQMGFQEIAKYYYSPGWHEPGTCLEFFVNKEKFDSLPADLQCIILTAGAYINVWCLSKMEATNSEFMAKMMAEGKVNIRRFPNDVLETLRSLTKEVLDEMVAADPMAQKVYASYRSFQEKSATYAAITEKVYYDELMIS